MAKVFIPKSSIMSDMKYFFAYSRAVLLTVFSGHLFHKPFITEKREVNREFLHVLFNSEKRNVFYRMLSAVGFFSSTTATATSLAAKDTIMHKVVLGNRHFRLR